MIGLECLGSAVPNIFYYKERWLVISPASDCERSELLIRQVYQFELGCIKKVAH